MIILTYQRVSFLSVTDPDILTGYNIINFDLPYLLNRANVLNLSTFPFLGRLLGVKTKMHETRLSSSAFGTHESKAFTMNGRIIVDMLQVSSRLCCIGMIMKIILDSCT